MTTSLKKIEFLVSELNRFASEHFTSNLSFQEFEEQVEQIEKQATAIVSDDKIVAKISTCEHTDSTTYKFVERNEFLTVTECGLIDGDNILEIEVSRYHHIQPTSTEIKVSYNNKSYTLECRTY